MATFTKTFLSESSNGANIGLATGGNTLVHTTTASSTVIDEVWLYLSNLDSSDQTVEVYLSSTVDAMTSATIPAQSGLVLLLPGLPFSGDGTTGLGIYVVPSINWYIQAVGYVNRITP